LLNSYVASAATSLTVIQEARTDAVADEAQARQRARQAEGNLAGALRGSASAATAITVDGKGSIYGVAVVPEDSERVSVERRDDGLTLAALWDLTRKGPGSLTPASRIVVA
jgi:hypothetical protein